MNEIHFKQFIGLRHIEFYRVISNKVMIVSKLSLLIVKINQSDFTLKLLNVYIENLSLCNYDLTSIEIGNEVEIDYMEVHNC